MILATVKINLVSQCYKTVTETLLVAQTASGAFRPLPEPIRLQDSVHLARSRAKKKKKKQNPIIRAESFRLFAINTSIDLYFGVLLALR